MTVYNNPICIGKVHALVQARWSISKIARELHMDTKTVRRIRDVDADNIPLTKRRTAKRISVRRGVVRKLVEEIRVDVKGVEFPVNPSAPAVCEAYRKRANVPCSASTVRRDLKALGFKCYVRKHVPCSDPAVHKKRYEFSKKIRAMRKNVVKFIFSDEHIVTANDYSCRFQHVKSKADIRYRKKMRDQNVARVQIWGAIGVGYKGPLVIFPEFKPESSDEEWGPTCKRGRSFTLTAKGYVRRCLSKISSRLSGRIFMQDNARVHVASSVLQYMQSKGVDCVQEWPAYSPDLNPIEQLWALINQRVSEYRANTREELENAIQDVWDNLSQKEIDAFAASFESKIERCFARRGEP
jgi:transposase